MAIDFKTEFKCTKCGKLKTGIRNKQDVCNYCLYKQWKLNHPEKAKEVNKKHAKLWCDKNREYYREYQKNYHRKYYEANKERLKLERHESASEIVKLEKI